MGGYNMKSKSRFETLLAQARGETPPQVDVAANVLMVLASGRVSDRPLLWLAALSSAFAVPAAVVAGVIMYNAWADPLVELSEVISWVMQ